MNHRLGRLDESKGKHENIYLLGLSLSGDPELLKTALAKLKAKGVEVTWISALEMPADMRVGGKEELKCDVRLITATNRDLPRLVVEGKFREDLYQRLNVVQLRTPSLREHKADIPIIANAWWRKFHDNAVLKDAQIAALMDYDYPGNVRELINILDRATASPRRRKTPFRTFGKQGRSPHRLPHRASIMV